MARIPIAREGLPIVAFTLVPGVVFELGAFTWHPLLHLLGGALLAFTCFSLWFFRDPERHFEGPADVVVSSADGRVLKVEDLESNAYTDQPCRRVSIFMSPFNVHVNRAPVEGRVTEARYHAGKFFVASLDKASTDNERNALFMETLDGQTVVSVQIAGLVARRIVCRVQAGAQLGRGERYGLIRFGSRMEHYLPRDAEILVEPGQHVSAGSTALARLPSRES